MLSARGSALLFADADGATKFNDLEKLKESLVDILGCKLSIPETNEALIIFIIHRPIFINRFNIPLYNEHRFLNIMYYLIMLLYITIYFLILLSALICFS